MKPEFSKIEFVGIGAETGSNDAMWGRLFFTLYDKDTGRYPSAELTLFLPKRPDVTFSELQSAARDQAIAVLREALACLEAQTVAELEHLSRERQAEHNKHYFDRKD